MTTLTIGQLARACDVGVEAIRFYEREGLLPAPQRTLAGYRQYSADSVQRLNFIRRAKNLGFTLSEIRELLALHDDPHGDRALVKALTKSKLVQIENKIHDLMQMRNALSDLAAECSGVGPVSSCPIIQALEQPETESLKRSPEEVRQA